jgi:hypothetical protein
MLIETGGHGFFSERIGTYLETLSRQGKIYLER